MGRRRWVSGRSLALQVEPLGVLTPTCRCLWRTGCIRHDHKLYKSMPWTEFCWQLKGYCGRANCEPRVRCSIAVMQMHSR